MNIATFMSSRTAGYLFIFLAILNWSGNFVAARGFAGLVDPATVNMIRWLLASVLWLPFGYRAFWRERKKICTLWKELNIIALTGISLYDTLIFFAGHTAEALNMSLISTLSPLLTTLIAQFMFKEKLKPQMYMGIALSTFGVALLVTDGNLERISTMQFAQGDLLILCTAMMSATYNTTMSRITGNLSQSASFTALCLFGTVQIIPLYLWETGGKIILPEFSFSLFWSFLYLAVFASIFCYLLWNKAIELLGAPRTALFYYTLPPMSGIAAWLVLGEPVQQTQVVSGCVVVFGIIFALYGGSLRWKKKRVQAYSQ